MSLIYNYRTPLKQNSKPHFPGIVALNLATSVLRKGGRQPAPEVGAFSIGLGFMVGTSCGTYDED